MKLELPVKIHKMVIVYSVLLFSLFYNSFGQTGNFEKQPWKNDQYPIIIDSYYLNSLKFDQIVKNKQVAGVLHKTSQGLNEDKKYKERSNITKEKGLLNGSYHLGTNIDPIRQADFYLNLIGENKSEPMALDIEDIGGNNISLSDAEKFIKRIFEKTGKYPFVYVNHKVFAEISGKYDKNSIFAKCPLWYARFVNTLPKISTKVWDKVTLWQFASEINCRKTSTEYAPDCPYKINGTANDIDINVFNGTFDELNKFWNKSVASNDSGIDSFIKNNFTESAKSKKRLIGKDFGCGYKEVYFVEGFDSANNLKERYLVYLKSGKFSKSFDFFLWIADHFRVWEKPIFSDSTGSESEKMSVVNSLLKIKPVSSTKFKVALFYGIPENSDHNFSNQVYFSGNQAKNNYKFPVAENCK